MFLTHASAHTLHLLFPNSGPLDHFQLLYKLLFSKNLVHCTCDSRSDCFPGRKTSVCSLVSEAALKAPSAVLFHRCVDSHTANGRAELY